MTTKRSLTRFAVRSSWRDTPSERRRRGGGRWGSIARGEPDAVVLDIGLPDLNGRVVAARMRAGGLATPILVLSALDQVDDRIAGLEAGADDYPVKPFAI